MNYYFPDSETGYKQVQSRIPEAPDQMMYTVCGDDTIYVPLSVSARITELGIRKMELMSICKRQQNGVTRWEVKRAGDATTTALKSVAKSESEPPTMLENQLNRSIDQVKVQCDYGLCVCGISRSPLRTSSRPNY